MKQTSPIAFRQALLNLKPKIKQQSTKIILRDQGRRIASLKESEFKKGERPDGSKIGRYKSPAYAKKKASISSLAGFGQIDLTLSGASNRGLFPIQKANGFALDTNTPQWGYNINRYGNDITSVNQTDFEEIQAKYHAPELVRFINEQLQIR